MSADQNADAVQGLAEAIHAMTCACEEDGDRKWVSGGSPGDENWCPLGDDAETIASALLALPDEVRAALMRLDGRMEPWSSDEPSSNASQTVSPSSRSTGLTERTSTAEPTIPRSTPSSPTTSTSTPTGTASPSSADPEVERDEFGRVKVEPTRMSFDDLLDAYTLQRLRDDLAAMHAVSFPCWEMRRG